LCPGAGIVSARFANTIYRQLVKDLTDQKRYKMMMNEWEKANMGWVKLQ
jgi:hypothetical protein